MPRFFFARATRKRVMGGGRLWEEKFGDKSQEFGFGQVTSEMPRRTPHGHRMQGLEAQAGVIDGDVTCVL